MNSKLILMATMAMTMMASIFKSNRKGSDPYQPAAPLPTGEIHITSRGKRRPFVLIPKLRDPEKINKHRAMVEELRQKGIVWHNNKLYWNTRKLAEENGGVI
jgi:hypothetical protein